MRQRYMKHGLESWACASLCTCECVPVHKCSAHVLCICICTHLYTCECLHVCGSERGVAHRCKEIGSLPQESRLPPLPAPTPCSGRGPSSIKRAGSPECPCCSIPHLPALLPRPVPERGSQKHQGSSAPKLHRSRYWCEGRRVGVRRLQPPPQRHGGTGVCAPAR